MFKKKKNRIWQLFNLGTDNDHFYEKLEDSLIEADISPRIAIEISAELKKREPGNVDDLVSFIRHSLQGMIHSSELSPSMKEPGCWLFLGVNGVGKTTSLVKLAEYWKTRGINVILAAGDTFRAAAVEQLETHAERLALRCVRQKQGADPGAVIFDAIESARSQGNALVMADSAGRMHSKSHLMKELQKIDRIIKSKIDGKQYKKLLVIDATTGQNAIQQAEVFHEVLGIDGIILSKYDSRARGGLALSISRQIGLPFVFLGTGEGYTDIQPFTAAHVVDRIMATVEQSPA